MLPFNGGPLKTKGKFLVISSFIVIAVIFTGWWLSDAQAAPLGAGTINLNPSSGPPGSTVTVSGGNWGGSNNPYRIIWGDKDNGQILGTFNPGNFSVNVTIPGGASAGDHKIWACAGHGTEFETCASAIFKVTSPATNTPIPPTFTPTPLPTATFTPTPTLEACIDEVTILSPENGGELGGVETTDLVVEIIYGRDEAPEVEFYGNNRFVPYTKWPDPKEGTTVEVEEDPANPHRYVFTVPNFPIQRGRNESKVEISRTCGYPREVITYYNGIPFTPTPRPDMCGGIRFGEGTEIITFNYTGSTSNFRTNTKRDYGVVFGPLFDVYRPEDVQPRSGRYAASSMAGMEFGHTLHPIRMTFLDPLTAVGTYVGLEEVKYVETEVTAILSVYGLEGGEGETVLLGSDATTFPPEPTDIKHCLSFEAEEGDLITQASVEYENAEGISLAERRLMDDLTILRASDAVVENQPPEVSITNPEEGSTVELTDFAGRAEILEDRELTTVWVRVNEGDWEEVAFSPHTSHPAKYMVATTFGISDLLYGTDNTLEVRAEDSAGQQHTDTVTFEFLPDETFTVHDLEFAYTQHGVFDVEGFPSFLVANKSGALRVTGLPQVGGSVSPVSVSTAQLWMTDASGTRSFVQGLQKVGNEFELVRPISTGDLELYFFIGYGLDPGTYDFEFVLKSGGDTVFHEDLGSVTFQEIPVQYQFHAPVEDLFIGANAAGFYGQMMHMARLYPVPDGVAPFGSPLARSGDAGIIYAVAPSVIDLPNGTNPFTGTPSFAWDFIYDGSGNRRRLNETSGVVDCNVDGTIDGDDKETKWLQGDGSGGFKLGTTDPPGHVQWDWNKPEDVDGDGNITQNEIGLWVVEFIDKDGDGEWHDYVGPERDLFSPGDPYHTYKDNNRNCKMDDSEKSTMAPGARRKSNGWGYIRRQSEMMMDEFAAANGLERMATSAVLPGSRTTSFNVLGNCSRGTICWDATTPNSMVIAHELGHGWGLSHERPRTFAGGALNLMERRWIPEGDTRNFMFWLVGNEPRENFTSASRFEQLYYRGLDGWNYFGRSSSARKSDGNLLAKRRLPPQLEKEATFALYGSIVEDGHLHIAETRVYHQALGQIPQAGPYRLAFLNQEGDLLSETSFGVTEESICDGCPDDEEHLTLEFPYVSVHAPYPMETETVEIYHEGELLHSLEVSLRAPSVEWKAPLSGSIPRDQPVTLRWTGGDEDGDTLTYSLAYSSDGGRTFTPIATGVSGTAYDWQPSLAAGSQEAILKVTANDGFHTSSAQSPTLALQKGSPVVDILTPRDGQEMGHRSEIVLEAYAVDPEDGTLTRNALVWTDSAGESLGTGKRIVLDGYQQGDQMFTVTATDADGNQNSQSVTVSVVESPPKRQAELNEDIVIEPSTETLAYGECEPTKATIRATFPEGLSIDRATLLIDKSGLSGDPVAMEKESGNTYLAEIAVSVDDPAGTWSVAAFASGGFGEAWSGTNHLEVVSCDAEENVSEAPESEGIDLPSPRVLLTAGAGILSVLSLGVILYLLLRKQQTN
ncbi:MAG: hypothetical protein R6U57_02300 [Anaerolineales bacterium]